MLKGLLVLCSLFASSAGFAQGPVVNHPRESAPITLNRKIELMIRSRFSIPGNCDLRIGSRTASAIPGYDALQVTVSQGAKSNKVDFLISTDNKTLARLEKFALDDNPALSINVQGRPIRGNPSAQVTVISFDDLECPACAYMHQQLFPAAMNRYGNEVRFIYKDNPLVELHPWALHAAVDAGCLADQSANAYWGYIDYIHSHVQEVSGTTRDLPKSFAALDRIAGEQAPAANMDSNRLQACLKRQDETPVLQSMKEAQQLGLNFTPALFVNGEEVRGLTSIGDLWNVIDRVLRESVVSPPASESPQPGKEMHPPVQAGPA